MGLLVLSSLTEGAGIDTVVLSISEGYVKVTEGQVSNRTQVEAVVRVTVSERMTLR